MVFFFFFLILKILLFINLLFPQIIYSSEVYTVQAGAFSTEKNAIDILDSLKADGITCEIQKSDSLYKVFCGEFLNLSDVNSLKTKLNSLKYGDAFIVQKNSFTAPTTSDEIFTHLRTPGIYGREEEKKSPSEFTGPGNRGLTGLMEIPTARVMREESYRFGLSTVHPYWYYYIGFSPLEGLEIFGRFTKIQGVGTGWKGYGDYKDRAFELKYQFLPEGKYTPALAIGIMDPHGTRLYPSQYIVASKQIYPFDFTIGIGNGRFGKKPLPSKEDAGFRMEILQDPKGWLRDSQFFWGIQFAPSEKYAFMIEYSPILYHRQTTDPALRKYFKEPVPSKYNFGLRLSPFKWTELDLSYQRGDTFGFQLSFNFDIGKPMLPIIEPPYRERFEDSTLPLNQRIANVLIQSGFSDIGIKVIYDEIWIDLQNDKYFYSTKALGIIIDNIIPLIPESIQRINITLKKLGIPAFTFSTTREDVIDLHRNKMNKSEFWKISTIDTHVIHLPEDEIRLGKYSLSYGIKPSFETSFEKAVEFFQYRIGIEAWADYRLWKGASFAAGVSTYPVNTITGMEPLSKPVRSDILNYIEEKTSLNRLMFNQIWKLTPDIYGRVSFGLLEIQYGGFDVEVASPLLNGRFLLGVSGSVVKKREPGSPFGFKNEDKEFYTTALLNTMLNFPEYEVSLGMTGGRFLAGDIGTRIIASKFIRGVTISAWYSFTNTSIFRDDKNRGYHDKGIFISIPLMLFTGRDSQTRYFYTIAPWTRDVAQDIYHYRDLFSFIGRDTKIYLDKDKKMMFK